MCETLSLKDCEGYTEADDTGKAFAQCKKSGKNCLAVGPACKGSKAPKKKHWIRGPDGAYCNNVCKDNGFKKCNKQEMAKITTKDLIKAKMKEAGYTCKSVGGHRSYSGSPFSTNRAGDDCYYYSPGTAASSINCDHNSYGHHAPLCYCD